jgi:hypothetical protein
LTIYKVVTVQQLLETTGDKTTCTLYELYDHVTSTQQAHTFHLTSRPTSNEHLVCFSMQHDVSH